MKILLVSASTKQEGTTNRAAKEVKERLIKLGCEVKIFNLMPSRIYSCCGCNLCKSDGRCKLSDAADEVLEAAPDFDGYIFLSPVHYGCAAGNLLSFLERLFYSKKSALKYKPAAAITVSRRGGNLSALESITRFFSFNAMPTVSGNYPGIVHGTTQGELERDEEGLQTLRSIADNMVWLIGCIEAGKLSGIYPPKEEKKIKTNYIR